MRIKPLHTMCRVTAYNSSIFFYKKLCKNTDMKERVLSLRGSKAGKRCFIIGNGPSLNSEDLEKLVNEDCFASNHIYKIFNKTTWRPKYYLIKDRYLNISPKDIDEMDVENIFVGDYYWRFHNSIKGKNIICLHEKYSLNEKKLKVSTDISKCFYSADTVSFAHMQLAAYMGYTEIYLLGFDHNYTYEVQQNGEIRQTSTKISHFFKDETKEESTADVQRITEAYKTFKRYAELHGITIKNATRGGKLEVFERINFDDLL